MTIFRSRALLVVALALAATGAPSLAAPPFKLEQIPSTPTIANRRAATIEALSFGFEGYVPSDAWSPVRVYISGNPEIRSGAFAGTLSIEFEQDATQTALISTVVSTTPGRVTPVDLVAAIPASYSTITIELRDDRGTLVHSRMYSKLGSLGEPTPAEWIDTASIVVAVADRTGVVPSFSRSFDDPAAVQAAVERARSDQKASTISLVSGVVVAAPDLPQVAEALDGLGAVVANSDALSALAPAQASALARWVRRGGTLVVPLGAEAQAWKSTLGFESLPVEIREARAVQPGKDLRRILTNTSESIRGRTLTLADNAETWRIRWADAGATLHDGLPTEGLIAEGPVGLGWLVVVGVEPGAVAGESSRLKSLWMSALGGTRIGPKVGDQNDEWYNLSSGATRENQWAIRAALDSQIEKPPVGDGIFLAIAGGMVLLAIAIGPVDALVLRRINRRSWSWLTALGWIGVASIIAAAGPPLVRTDKATFNRLRVNDVLGGENPVGESVALSSFFAAAPSTLQLRGQGPDAKPFGWFRGVSGLWRNKFDNSAPLMTFRTVEADTRLASGEARRSNVPLEPVTLSQWTLRSLMDTAPVQSAPGVEWRREQGSWVAVIRGVTGTPRIAALSLGETWHDGATATASGELRFTVGALMARENIWTRGSDDSYEATPRVLDSYPGVMFHLPGAQSRTHAIDRYLASGAWGCIYILMDHTAPTLLATGASGREFEPAETTLWRLVVPLPPALRSTQQSPEDQFMKAEPSR